MTRFVDHRRRDNSAETTCRRQEFSDLHGDEGHQARNQLRSHVRALTAGTRLQKTNVEAIEDANENERML